MGVLEQVCLALRDVNSPRQIHVFLSRQKEDCLELFVCQAPESVSYHLPLDAEATIGWTLGPGAAATVRSNSRSCYCNCLAPDLNEITGALQKLCRIRDPPLLQL